MNRFAVKLAITIRGHIFNPPWKSRLERRRHRGEVISKYVCRYLERYVPSFSDVEADSEVADADEKIFSIWFQGEQAAPPLVQACWRSIRKHCTQELVVLDEKSLFDWIDLPDHIVRKWKDGKMRPAHFADICRIELLYRYGGFWMDATDYVAAPMPQWLLGQDFFVFLSGQKQRGAYSFIQNCFIRSRRGAYLLKAWRAAVLAYWREEDSTIDYFVHQLLFKMVVENNAAATECFSKMIKLDQDPTHVLWFENADEPFDEALFQQIVSDAVFQKTDYKSEPAKNPKPGSFADRLISGI